MSCQLRKLALVCSAVLLAAGSAFAQESGMPGDGIPDFYYFSMDGLTAATSMGDVSRPAGTLLLDTDGFDGGVVAMLVGGPNVSVAPGCDLCNNQQLPTSSLSGDTYTVGFAAGSTQWVRTSPLSGRGFLGVIGTGYTDNTGAVQNSWPADFPPFLTFTTRKEGLANYGAGLSDQDFSRVFNDGATEALWSVRVASDNGSAMYTNVTVLVPEPTTGLMSIIGLALASFLRRR